MGILEKVFLWFLQTSFTASIVIIVISLILKIFNNHISVRVKHGLCILIVIRLLIPVIPEMSINLFSTLYQKYENVLQLQSQRSNSTEEKELYSEGKEQNDNVNHNKNIQINEKDNEQKINNQNLILFTLKIVSIIWIIGLFILISTFLLFIFNFKRKIKHVQLHTYPEIQLLMNECRYKANITSKIPIFIYDGFKSPCILGILKPKIYIPEYVLKINDNTQISHILLHELMHYKRKDLVYNFLGIIALSIHWFNPLVWIAISKMKIYREYACDACVLEILGEKECIEYGMTLINFSKMFSNKKQYSQLAICFETNSQIKRRIKMIKKFKQGSYKISAMSLLCCAVAATVVLTGSIKVKALDVNNNVTANASNKINSIDKHEFLIDSSLKIYDDMKKAQNIAGFKFKIPDFIPEGYQVDAGFQIGKLSENNNALSIGFSKPNKHKDAFSLDIFETKPAESLKEIGDAHNKYYKDSNVEVEEQSMQLGTINGSQITLTTTTPAKDEDGFHIESRKRIEKYFVWKNEGVYYCIGYNSTYINGEKKSEWSNISEDTIEKIAQSIKYPNEINNVNYNVDREVSTEIGQMGIYDKEDLEKAKGLLGFNPKLPLKINEDIKINDSCVGISGNSDIKNNKINYELNSFYSNKNGSITFTAEKNSQIYEDIKKNGYFTEENLEDNKSEKIKAEKMNINDTEVFKYECNGDNSIVDYTWKENNIYYNVMFVNKCENSDEIINEFVNSKPID
ncbi:M56 family metallopeptidase [Clostridium uliginosum]|uniref:Bla regulator protein blaR1 n=1 Tax=Clostridium uliginosum TaxID=119641 RepID=A0A1I1IUA9_9CLOT|nr:M56 family metallopeptidase [Clostridium uliginosum]SFC37313.1 bla regulator protein blaR1 [Clostridium uliginosum]